MEREKITSVAIIAPFLLLVLGLVNIEIIQGSKYRKLGDKNCIKLIPQAGSRGTIFDRDGAIVANSKLSYDVMVLAQDNGIVALDNVLIRIASVLGMGTKELKDSYRRNFISSTVPVSVARNIEARKAMVLEQLKNDYPNIIIQPQALRNYPNAKSACHLLGYVSEIDRWRLTKLEDYGYKTKDIVGFAGLEEKYDYYLRQDEGGLSFQIDSRGNFMRALGFQAPRSGKDIQLTIDLKVQKIAESCLGERIGSVVIIDPYTGEIIAMASNPGFNPRSFSERQNSQIAEYFSDRDAPLVNRAISSAYPAGSVFKVIVATAGLETGRINLGTTFLCTGKTMVGRKEFSCWQSHGEQDIIHAITHSCNVFFYRTGLLLGAPSIYDYALKFGLSHPTGFELPYEASGNIPSPLRRKIYKFQNWYDGDTANLSIGQGDVLVTPLQMARMICVFANHGLLVTPYVVKSIGGKDISRYQKKVTSLRLKASTIENIRRGLRSVVFETTGTANVVSAVPVSVAGKTGTAQAPPGQPHSWFVGFFPFQKPQYAICVMLEHGGPGYYASVVAKQIIEEMVKESLVVSQP